VGVLLKLTIFFCPNGESGTERAESNSHRMNSALVYVVWMEGTNNNASTVSSQLSYLPSSYFSDVHPVLMNCPI